MSNTRFFFLAHNESFLKTILDSRGYLSPTLCAASHGMCAFSRLPEGPRDNASAGWYNYCFGCRLTVGRFAFRRCLPIWKKRWDFRIICVWSSIHYGCRAGKSDCQYIVLCEIYYNFMWKSSVISWVFRIRFINKNSIFNPIFFSNSTIFWQYDHTKISIEYNNNVIDFLVHGYNILWLTSLNKNVQNVSTTDMVINVIHDFLSIWLAQTRFLIDRKQQLLI